MTFGGLSINYYLNLLWGPGVKVDRLDARDMYTQIPMDTSTAYAHEDSEVPTSPSRTYNNTIQLLMTESINKIECNTKE